VDTGAHAEALVLEHLRAQGLEIVAQNLRLGRLELDIVAREGRTIVVVEVRSRGTGAWTRALGSIDREKQRRVRRAGQRLWQRRYRHDPSVDRLRFDAAAVRFTEGGPRIEYIQAAF
jgi:putative endonuclease